MNAPTNSPDLSHRSRVATYGAVSTALALLSDEQLGKLVDAAPALSSGIGGTAVLLDVEGTTVFVKRMPLTDLDRLPGNVMSTGNTFHLPAICHYGIGGPGWGAWRELAVQTMTTNWVLGGESENFPLMYHWRVLPQSAPAVMHEELRDTEKVVEFWGGSAAVGERLAGLEQSTASVALFLECIPQTLHTWLDVQIKEGGEAAESACAMVERELADGTAFMNARGLLHFDAHFENILTDGRRLYFTDFGLALSTRFDLSAEEKEFYHEHESYDRAYAFNHFANWLSTALHGYDRAGRQEFLGACAGGVRPEGIPEGVAEILMRYAPLAVVMSEFLRSLQTESRTTPYPGEQLQGVDVVRAG